MYNLLHLEAVVHRRSAATREAVKSTITNTKRKYDVHICNAQIMLDKFLPEHEVTYTMKTN